MAVHQNKAIEKNTTLGFVFVSLSFIAVWIYTSLQRFICKVCNGAVVNISGDHSQSLRSQNFI